MSRAAADPAASDAGLSGVQGASAYAGRMAVYNAAWMAALPVLWFFPRLRAGFRERLAPLDFSARSDAATGAGHGQWQDVWLHAASGGESYLAWELVKRFPSLPGRHGAEPTHLLATSWTEQGVGVLDQAAAWRHAERPDLRLCRGYVPFDAPSLMRKALRAVMPKVVVLLETELWPGLLWACKMEDTPVLVVNGRLTRKSLAGLLAFRGFLRSVAPDRILAVSELDARRYALLFGADRVELMSNIKFDRMAPLDTHPAGRDPLAGLLDPRAAFVVLGSVRTEEEPAIQDLLRLLFEARPDCSVGLFPKQLRRVEAWSKHLRVGGYSWTLRSQLRGPVGKGRVVLWDRFGELGQAYGRCQAAFVGGSLKPLGGQNFLEPLAQGVIPCIGPHWDNFAWVGPELVAQGLARVAESVGELAQSILECLARPEARDEVRRRFEAYLAPRRGGAATACAAIAGYLSRPSDVSTRS